MKKPLFTLLCYFLTIGLAVAQITWMPVGPNDRTRMSMPEARQNNLVFNNGTTYIAFSDADYGGAYVKKFNGTGWDNLGFGPAYTSYSGNLKLIFDSSNRPYIIFDDEDFDGKLTMRRFDGMSWQDVGPRGFSSASADNLSVIAVGQDIYVAYTNGDVDDLVEVMKYDGNSWTFVGTPQELNAEASYLDLSADATGNIYLAYVHEVEENFSDFNRIAVKKLNGNSWVTIPNAGFSDIDAREVALAVYQGVPYVVYSDTDDDYKASLRKFNGTIWETVGIGPLSMGGADYISFEIDATGAPYVAYQDEENNDFGTVMKYDANTAVWNALGGPAFTVGEARDHSLAFLNGNVHLLFRDDTKSDALTLMKFDGNAWAEVGATISVSPDSANYPYMAFAGNTPYVSYEDEKNGDRLSVSKFNGTSWELVGPGGFAPGSGYHGFAIHNGVPYVAFTNDDNSDRLSVMKFNPSTGDWEYVGAELITADDANDPVLGFINDQPFVVYNDEPNSGRISAMIFDGNTWQQAGVAGASTGTDASYLNMAIEGNVAYVTFSEELNGTTKISVLKFENGSWYNVGAPGISEAASYPSIAVSNGVPYVAYADYEDNGLSVAKFEAGNWTKILDQGAGAGQTITNGEEVSYTKIVVANNTPYVTYRNDDKDNIIEVKTFNGTNWENLNDNLASSRSTRPFISIGPDAKLYTAYSSNGIYVKVLSEHVTLPVTLVDFNAKATNQGALLTWRTSSEQDNSHFVIEKSTDGNVFAKLVDIPAKGKGDYSYTDAHFNTSAYYRLKQVDRNGDATVYTDKVRYVKLPLLQTKIVVYPNPVIDKVSISFGNVAASTVTAKLLDISGKVLVVKTGSPLNGFSFDLSSLPSGVYILNAEIDGKSITKKVIKN